MMAHLRMQRLRSIIYLGDILIMHQSREGLSYQIERTIQLLESLRFTINREESQTTPSQ